MTLSSGSGQFTGQKARRPHLVRGGGGLKGEVADLRSDISSDLSANAGMAVDEFTDEPVADVDAIVTSFATSASIQVLAGAALDGVVGAAEMDAPRNITITSDAQVDHDAVDVVIDGTDINNDVVQDTITKTDGGNTTDVGTVAFKTVTKITIPAEAGAGGLQEIGFGPVMGLSKPLVSRAGLEAVIQEIAIGAVVTTGTFVDAATTAPNGTYAPSAAQDGSNDYAAYYEYDASQNQ